MQTRVSTNPSENLATRFDEPRGLCLGVTVLIAWETKIPSELDPAQCTPIAGLSKDGFPK
jgi:hypothetical protein